MKAKDFIDVAKSLGLETASVVWKNHDNSAIVSTSLKEVQGSSIHNVDRFYSFTLGSFDLRSNSEAEMYDYWLSLEGDGGNVECVKIFPETAVQTLKEMCEDYGLPVPTEIVNLIEAIFA